MKRSLVLALLAWTAPGVSLAQPAPTPTPSPEASAATTPEAEYARGEAMRAEHRDADALAHFRALYDRTQEPRALAQVGLAESALGRWLDAEAHVIEALTALRDPWITRNRLALLATLEAMRTHIGTLVVSADFDPADVWIGGRRVGSTNTPLHVLAGDVSFEVRAEGRPAVRRTVAVAPNTTARESVRFNEGAPDASAGTATTPTSTAPGRASTDRTPRGVLDPSRGSNSSTGGAQRTLGWTAVGTGAALVAGGVAAWFLGRSAADAYNHDPTCPGVGAPSQSDACASAQSTAATLEPLAWVAGGLGAALAVTGAVLVGTASDRGAVDSVARRCGAVVGPWSGVSCGLSF